MPRSAVVRPTSSAVTFWIVVGFCALLLADSVVRRDWHVVGLSIGPVLFVLWVVWLLAFRPSIRLDDDAITAVNPGWRVRVPWTRVTDARQRLQLVLELDDGRDVTCWGSPFPAKPGAGRGIRSESAITPQPDAAARALDAVRGRLFAAGEKAAGQAPEPVERRIDWAILAVGAVLLVAVLVELFV